MDIFASVPAASATTPNQSISYWILGVVAVIVIAVIAYYYLRPKPKYIENKGPFVLLGTSATPADGSNVNIFEYSQIINGMGNNFSLSFFVYMDDVNRERIPIGGNGSTEMFQFKPLVTILGVGTITADPIYQKARVRIQALRSRPIEPSEPQDVVVPNFMISRWNQITLTVEGRTVDIYLNGALVKSTLLENIPLLYPVGVLLETSPDFAGQAGLFQAWPYRLTEPEVAANYKRNTDLRGKPNIPDAKFDFSDFFRLFRQSFCSTGICDWFTFGDLDPFKYVEYEYA